MPRYAIDELTDLPDGSVALVFTEPEAMPGLTVEIVRKLSAQAELIYVSITKPVEHQLEVFRQAGIDTSKVHCVDCLSKVVGAEAKVVNHTIVVHPSNLIGISRAISELLTRLEGKKIVYFEPVTTLLIYNTLPALAKFVTFVVTRIREARASAVFISLVGERSEELTQELEKMSDRIIKV